MWSWRITIDGWIVDLYRLPTRVGTEIRVRVRWLSFGFGAPDIGTRDFLKRILGGTTDSGLTRSWELSSLVTQSIHQSQNIKISGCLYDLVFPWRSRDSHLYARLDDETSFSAVEAPGSDQFLSRFRCIVCTVFLKSRLNVVLYSFLIILRWLE